MDLMKHPLEFLMPPQIGAELIYSFVIIVCSLMVYYATKEMYELSSYKGIKYFRQAFLFFAIAYFFRYFIQFFLVFFNIKDILTFTYKDFTIEEICQNGDFIDISNDIINKMKNEKINDN